MHTSSGFDRSRNHHSYSIQLAQRNVKVGPAVTDRTVADNLAAMILFHPLLTISLHDSKCAHTSIFIVYL